MRDNRVFFFASSGVGGVHPPVFSLGRRMMDSEQASDVNVSKQAL